MADANPITMPEGHEGSIAPRVFAKGGEVFANSRDVASFFEKEHRDVLRAIDNLIAQEPDLASERLRSFAQSFAEVETGNGTCRQFRTFDMTRDGFSLLAMGFTGPRALKWKLRYIEAFNMMEARLSAPVAALPDASADVSLREQELALKLVREARVVFGPGAARRLWAQLDLPSLVEGEAPAPVAAEEWRGALRHLLLATTQEATTIWAMIRHATGGASDIPSKQAGIWLERRGLAIDGYQEMGLFVANSGPWLEGHFVGTPWAGCWRAAMKGAPGAQGMRMRLQHRQQRGWRIPLRLIAALATEGAA